MPDTLLQHQSICTLVVKGREMKFVFNKLDGGGITVDGSRTYPGGGPRQKAHGGLQAVADLTGTFEFVPERDEADIKFCEQWAGKAEASLTQHRTDRDGNIVGRKNFWTGKLGDVDGGGFDAGSSDPLECEITIEADVKG